MSDELDPDVLIESYLNGNITHVVDTLLSLAVARPHHALALTASLESGLAKHDRTITGPLWRRVS